MKDKDYFGKDKLMHAGVCMLVSLVHPFLAAGMAIGKEYGDGKASGNHWCWWDLLADFIGIAVGSAVRFLVFGKVF